MDCICDDCGWKGPNNVLDEIYDFWSRVTPGEVIPAGECPMCHALAYPIDNCVTKAMKFQTEELIKQGII